MIFDINSTRGQTRFLTCVARVTCQVCYKVLHVHVILYVLRMYLPKAKI